MEKLISFNFKNLCDRISNLELNDIYEEINNEWNRVSVAKIDPKLKQQYQNDLLILLNLFVGAPLPQDLRPNFLDDSITLLFKLRNHLLSLKNLSEIIQNWSKQKREADLFDLITIVVSKEEIEENNIANVCRVLDTLLDKRKIKSFRNNVNIAFDGYNETSTELFHIPKFRNFIYKLDKYFPYWFYFLNKDTEALRVITFSLCGLIQVKPGLVKINQEHFAEFLDFHFHALNVLADCYAIDDSVNEQITEEIIQYYGIN